MNENSDSHIDQETLEKALEEAISLGEEVKSEMCDVVKSAFNTTVPSLLKPIKTDLHEEVELAKELLSSAKKSLKATEVSTRNEMIKATGMLNTSVKFFGSTETKISALIEEFEKIQKVFLSIKEKMEDTTKRFNQESNSLEIALRNLKKNSDHIEELAKRISTTSETLSRSMESREEQIKGNRELLDIMQKESIPILVRKSNKAISNLESSERVIKELKDNMIVLSNAQRKMIKPQIYIIVAGGASIIMLLWLIIQSFGL